MEKVDYERVLDEVRDALSHQLGKWGVQDHPVGSSPEGELAGATFAQYRQLLTEFNDEYANPFWGTILLEEVFEALAEPEDSDNLRHELLQVAAVAVAAVENLDRRNRKQE